VQAGDLAKAKLQKLIILSLMCCRSTGEHETINIGKVSTIEFRAEYR
jgi:hypothetical protein